MVLVEPLEQLKKSLARYSKSRLLHISEAAELLRVSEKRLIELAGKGRVRSFRVGEHWFMEEDWLSDFRALVKQSLATEIDELRLAAPHGRGWVRPLAPRRKLRLHFPWRQAATAVFAVPARLLSGSVWLASRSLRLAASPFVLSWRLALTVAAGAQSFSGGALSLALGALRNSTAAANYAFRLSLRSLKSLASGLAGGARFSLGSVAFIFNSLGRALVGIKRLAIRSALGLAAGAGHGALSVVRIASRAPKLAAGALRFSISPIAFVAGKSAAAATSFADAAAKELVILKNRFRLRWLGRHDNFWFKKRRFFRLDIRPAAYSIRRGARLLSYRGKAFWSDGRRRLSRSLAAILEGGRSRARRIAGIAASLLSSSFRSISGFFGSVKLMARFILLIFSAALPLAALTAMFAILILPLAQVGIQRRTIAANYLSAVYGTYSLPLAFVSGVSFDLPIDDESLTRAVYRWTGQNPPGQVAGAFEIMIR